MKQRHPRVITIPYRPIKALQVFSAHIVIGAIPPKNRYTFSTMLVLGLKKTFKAMFTIAMSSSRRFDCLYDVKY